MRTKKDNCPSQDIFIYSVICDCGYSANVRTNNHMKLAAKLHRKKCNGCIKTSSADSGYSTVSAKDTNFRQLVDIINRDNTSAISKHNL